MIRVTHTIKGQTREHNIRAQSTRFMLQK